MRRALRSEWPFIIIIIIIMDLPYPIEAITINNPVSHHHTVLPGHATAPWQVTLADAPHAHALP